MRGEAATSDERGATQPIYVDLDGTLIASDVLWESLCLFARRHPLRCIGALSWLRLGKAGFKRKLAAVVAPDPTLLPYRDEVVAILRNERERGRRIVLATATDAQIASRIADHLGCFDAVLASDGETNCAGENKRDAIARDANGEAFEYMGNSSTDVPVWKRAARAVLVAPTAGAARAAAALGVPSRTLAVGRTDRSAILRALRPHQWLKNALLFVPLLLAHELTDATRWFHVVVAFACFCAFASATYLVNDLSDIEADRQHPTKRKRPFAAGTLPIPTGIALAASLLGAGFLASASLLGPLTTLMLGIYLLLTTGYSFHFKERMAVDVLLLAVLYTHRVLTGAVAADVRISPWLLAFSMFFFLSLALLKRYVELRSAHERGLEKLERRNYSPDDVGLVESMGLTSGYLSVLVLCLFVSSDDVRVLYPTPEILWGISLIMLYWMTRMWFLARRGEVPDDPVLFAAGDRVSYACGAGLAIVVAAASLVGS